VVTVGGVASNGIWFPGPNITSVSPTWGAVGTSVTLSGTNFRSTQGSVFFNGTPATVTSWGNSVVVTVPVGATTGNIVLKTFNGILSNGVNLKVTGGSAP